MLYSTWRCSETLEFAKGMKNIKCYSKTPGWAKFSLPEEILKNPQKFLNI